MTRIAVPLLLGCVLLAGFQVLPRTDAAIQCADLRGCPDLTVVSAEFTPVITRESFAADDCAVVEGMVQPGTRTLLRFNFVTPNNGLGNLVVGNPNNHPEWFVWSDCHGHHHFVEYADYRLWNVSDFFEWDAYRNDFPNATPSDALNATGLTPIEGRKQGFCVIDIAPHGVGDLIPRYLSCANQGITRGWADAYALTLDGQWVDVTGLPHGAYVLEAEVNAERLYVETNYTNNRAWSVVLI